MWVQRLAAGSLFASPTVSSSPHHVYCATLGGLVVALVPVSALHQDLLLCWANVFFHCYCLLYVYAIQVYVLVMYIQSTGNKVWSHDLGQPIFSSPAVSSEAVVVACVDKRVYGFSHAGSKVLVLHFY